MKNAKTITQNPHNDFLSGLKDDILQAFMMQDFARVITLVDFGESKKADFGIESINNDDFVLSAIVISAIVIATQTKAHANSKITKQALKYATRLYQNSNKNSSKEKFCALMLAKSYAANGDVKESQGLLENLAKPYLNAKANIQGGGQ